MKVNRILNGRYELREQVGVGNYGVVFEGLDLHTRQCVAVKQLFEQVVKNAELMRITQVEIETLQRIDNRYIIKLLNHFPSNGLYYLIYEFCEKGDLKLNVDRLGRLAEQEALKFVYQMAEALCELKRCNIIHRDIKPENIFLAQDICKLGDFGLCHKGTRVQLNASVGSLGFLAPETQQQLIYSSKADVYSLGICFYEMLHGDIPFTTDMIERLLEIKINLRIERVPGIPLSDFTLDLLRRMINPSEQSRIDCTELRDILSQRFPQYRIDTPRQLYSPIQKFGQATPERRISQPMQTQSLSSASNSILNSGKPGLFVAEPAKLFPSNRANASNSNMAIQAVPQPAISNRHFAYVSQPVSQFPQASFGNQNQPFIDSKVGGYSPAKIRPFLHTQTDSKKYEPIQIKSSTPKESTFNFQALNSASKVSSTVLAGSTSHKLFQPSTIEYNMPAAQVYQPQTVAPLQYTQQPSNLPTSQPRGGYTQAASLMGESKPAYVFKPNSSSGIISGAFSSTNMAPVQPNTSYVSVQPSSRPLTSATEGNASNYLTRSPAAPAFQQQLLSRPKQVFNPTAYNPILQQNTFSVERLPTQSQSSNIKSLPQQPVSDCRPANGHVEVNQNTAFYTQSPNYRPSFPLDSSAVFDSRSNRASTTNRFSASEPKEEGIRELQGFKEEPKKIATSKDFELDLPDSYKREDPENMRRERRTTGERQNSQSILQMRINFSNQKKPANFEPKPLLKKLDPKAPGPRFGSKMNLQNQGELVSPPSGHRRVTSENPRLRNNQANQYYMELAKKTPNDKSTDNPLNKSLLSNKQGASRNPLQTVDSSRLGLNR